MEWTFSDSVRLSLLSFSEASKACAALPGFSLFRRSLQPERIEYCRAELLPDCLVGSLAVPDKTHPLHLAFSLAFYLDRGQLILAADEQTLPALQFTDTGRMWNFPSPEWSKAPAAAALRKRASAGTKERG